MELYHMFAILAVLGFIGVLCVIPFSKNGLAETRLERLCLYIISSIMLTMTVVGAVLALAFGATA